MKLRAWCSSYSNEGYSLGINRKWCRFPDQDLMNIQRRSVCSNWAMFTLRHWPDLLTTCLFAGSSTKSESKLWLDVKFLCSQNLCFRLMHKWVKTPKLVLWKGQRGCNSCLHTNAECFCYYYLCTHGWCQTGQEVFSSLSFLPHVSF